MRCVFCWQLSSLLIQGDSWRLLPYAALNTVKQQTVSMWLAARQSSPFLSRNQQLHFDRSISSKRVSPCPASPYVYAGVYPPSGPSFLLLPPLSPPPVAPWTPVGLQVETETWRGRLWPRGSPCSPESLQQRIVGIRPVARSLETRTSSRRLPWRDRRSLERGRSFHSE